jgi:hypothetical protein
MLKNEKYWNNPSIYEHNIMHCTVICWLLGDHGDRQWESNEGEIVNLIKHDIYKPEVPRQNSLGLSIYTLKNEG